ncbi:MAG: hypothetical protein ACTSPB_20600 [Candidatus Thorarchaeota archaeon]
MTVEIKEIMLYEWIGSARYGEAWMSIDQTVIIARPDCSKCRGERWMVFRGNGLPYLLDGEVIAARTKEDLTEKLLAEFSMKIHFNNGKIRWHGSGPDKISA